MFCIRGYLYKKISFFSFLKELNEKEDIKKHKIRLPYLFNCVKPLSYFRANKYKNEALYLKKLVKVLKYSGVDLFVAYLFYLFIYLNNMIIYLIK